MSIELMSTQDDKAKIESLEVELNGLRKLVSNQASGNPTRKWLSSLSSVDVMGFSGIAFVSVGVGCVEWKAGLIVAGILLIACGIFAARAE